MSAPLDVTHRVLPLPRRAEAPGLEPTGGGTTFNPGELLRQGNGIVLKGKKKGIKVTFQGKSCYSSPAVLQAQRNTGSGTCLRWSAPAF